MRITSKQILNVLYVLSFILFVGVCIDACGFIFSAFYTMTINSVNAKTTWPGVDLSALYSWDRGHFLVQLTYMSIVGVLKAIQFYLLLKILHDKKLNFSQPFNKETGRLISSLAFLAIGAGLFSSWGAKYTAWIETNGVPMPDVQDLRLGGADVWLYMGAILFVIAQIFKRGIEIQTENDLTV